MPWTRAVRGSTLAAAIAIAFSVPAAAQPALAPQAAAQINALVVEKATRTAVQQKMDSQVHYAVKMARGEAITAGVPALRVSLPDVNQRGAVLDLRADVSDSLLARLRGLGADVLDANPVYRSVRIRVPLRQVDAIAGLPDVAYVMPKQEYLTSRATSAVQGATEGEFQPQMGTSTSEGDATHRAALARALYGVSGAGVRVGVISDGVSNLALSQASGDLPVVTVLPGQGGSGDEGTAMLEIIHDLAPGAQLYFATGGNSIASFAQNIRDLAAAGCHVIVDDIGYFVESPFQDGQTYTSQTNGGIVAQAVKDVANAGVLYFSAAANSGNKNDNTSGTWEGDFVNGGAAGGVLTGAGLLHNFGGQTYTQFLLNTSNPVMLFWSDPLGGSTNDYDLFVLNSAGTAITAASASVQNGTQDPMEAVVSGLAGERVVIVLYSGSARFLHLATNRNRLSLSTAGSTHGHAATTAPNSFGVAATPAQSPGPYPNAFNAFNKVESFSSDGPRRLFFMSNGVAYTPGNLSSSGGVLIQKPDFTAADGVTVTGVGAFPSPFFGTSAAAPHAAAIAALVKSRNLSLPASQIRAALFASVVDIEAVGVDRDSGAGILMADLAVAAVSSRRTRGDFDGDGRAEIGIFRESTGVWYVWYAATGLGLNYLWGGVGDIPVVGDYDGDGLSDIAVFRPSNGTWYIRYTVNGASLGLGWGAPGDRPVPGDYTGDGKTDLAIFRPSNSTWYIRDSATGLLLTYAWGGPGDEPVQGDYDSDGRTDIAIFRPSTSTWYIRYTASGAGINLVWGGTGDVPVQADYDGDGRTDIAIFRASTGQWFVRYTATGLGVALVWGGGTDVPVPADYDGDGLDDIAIFRPSTGQWFIRFTVDGSMLTLGWGGSGDQPVLARP